MGNKCSDTAILSFEDCRVPQRFVLGQEGHGFYHIMTNFQGERLVGALAAVGGAQFALDQTVAYCKERKAFGRPITGFQVTRHKLVEAQTRVPSAARCLAYHAARLFEEQGPAATQEISMAKLHCCEVAIRVADACVHAPARRHGLRRRHLCLPLLP